MSWKAPITKNLKELRIHLCQNSPRSQGVRDFITKNYPALKKSNPGLPVLIREAEGVEARIYARYNFAQESRAIVDNMNETQVSQQLDQLIKAADAPAQGRISN
ncbi:hypothetical protein H4R33_005299 [Dimargaris cristalligena]|uniref:NADH dehydrogenase n=1 Tax=Dimargaris cristalligena TaxID=215637 RepID=A0A4P9ZMF7_9FUNG|nr:hypothetical protein H4R33_005299 [Dimargaris cristalligena]RKP34554.1 NADH dehydrogenase [Dimargaris cristalligena]|eukprot:RKP34554.1 NADH dehydrogenase [Dimargaris cristalligena]